MSKSGTTLLDERNTSLRTCPGVPRVILAAGAVAAAAACATTAMKLVDLFRENFKKYESGVSPEIMAAGPQ